MLYIFLCSEFAAVFPFTTYDAVVFVGQNNKFSNHLANDFWLLKLVLLFLSRRSLILSPKGFNSLSFKAFVSTSFRFYSYS